MKKSAIILLLSLVLLPNFGQERKPGFGDRIFFGGDFWISFGDITDILISPLVGYRITDRLSSGLGIKYEYYANKYPVRYDTHIYGGRSFVSYAFIRDLNNVIPVGIGLSMLAHCEYEGLNLERRYFDVYNQDREGRFWLHSLLVGGGVGIPTGERSGISLLVLWNLNDDARLLYSNPILRFGFTF